MEFTYDAYREMLFLLREHQYRPCGYFDYEDSGKCVILRHDIDYSVERALTLAQLEHDEGVRSTYFALLRTDFYNPSSKNVTDMLRQIHAMGHEVGLHFDEAAYPDCTAEELPALLKREARLLSDICDIPIRSFSMHRPNHITLEKNLHADGLVNSYGQEFFHNFKYLSDSRKNWREPVLDVIRSDEYARLHILTHAFWYREKDEDIKQRISCFIREAKMDRYSYMKSNIRDLGSILDPSEL